MPGEKPQSSDSAPASSPTTTSTPTSTKELETSTSHVSTPTHTTTSSSKTTSTEEKSTSTTTTHTTTPSNTTSSSKSTETRSTSTSSTHTQESSSTSSSLSSSTTSSSSSSSLSFPTTQSLPTTMTLSTSTATDTLTPFASPTTQSQGLPVSGTGDFTITSTYVSTDADGLTHQVTQIIAEPSPTGKPSGFASNPGAVAGVSVAVGLIGAAMLVFAFIYFRRRRAAQNVRDDELADFSQMSYAAGNGYGGTANGGDYYANAAGGSGSDYYASTAAASRDHIPMRSPSVGSLHTAPLAPVDGFARTSIIGHPYASRSARSNDSHHIMHDEFAQRTNGNDVYAQEEYNPYPSYAQDERPMSNHAGYGTAAAVRAQEAAPRNDWGAPRQPQQQQQQQYQAYGTNSHNQHNDDAYAAYEQQGSDPFAGEGGDELGGDAMSYYTNSHYHASPLAGNVNGNGNAPRRSTSTKSRAGMTFGKRDEDDYFDDAAHGPTNDDDSIVLGRTSTSHALASAADYADRRNFSRPYAR